MVERGIHQRGSVIGTSHPSICSVVSRKPEVDHLEILRSKYSHSSSSNTKVSCMRSISVASKDSRFIPSVEIDRHSAKFTTQLGTRQCAIDWSLGIAVQGSLFSSAAFLARLIQHLNRQNQRVRRHQITLTRTLGARPHSIKLRLDCIALLGVAEH